MEHGLGAKIPGLLRNDADLPMDYADEALVQYSELVLVV